MNEKVKHVMLPISLVSFYLVYLYFALSYAYGNGLLISIHDVTSLNICSKLIYDFFHSILIVIIIIIFALFTKKPLHDLGITKNNLVIIIVLLAINVLLFLIKGDFSVNGIYKFVFYLVFVAFSEEFIFRGYLFTELHKCFNFWISAIISGVLWGIPHGYMSAITSGRSLLLGIINNLGMGIVAGTAFAFLFKKSKTIFIPVLIHSILDFSSVSLSR